MVAIEVGAIVSFPQGNPDDPFRDLEDSRPEHKPIPVQEP
jgi:hypothetical protein